MINGIYIFKMFPLFSKKVASGKRARSYASRLSPIMRQAESPGLPPFGERLEGQGAKTPRDTFIISHNEPQRALDLVSAGLRCIFLARIATIGWASAESSKSLAKGKTDGVSGFAPERTGPDEVGASKPLQWTVEAENRQPGGLTV